MTTWKQTKNRGFNYGPSTSTPWVNDICWKAQVTKEAKMQATYWTKEGVLEGLFPPIGKKGGDGGSQASFKSKGSRSGSHMNAYKELADFDRMSAVAEDPYAELEGLEGKEKAEALVALLQRERRERVRRERLLMQAITNEKSAREAAEGNMHELAGKLDSIASGLGLKNGSGGYLRRTKRKV
jgi:hypothetical protein